MKTKIENYKRKEIFAHYDKNTNPFAAVTTKLDITNIYNLCREKGHFYATLGYYLTKSMCEIEEFRYTYEDGEFYLFDTIIPNYTDLDDDEMIGFFDVPLEADYEDYLTTFDAAKARFLNGESAEPSSNGAPLWLSCEPWFKATSIMPPFDKETRIPQLIWDRYEIENDRCYINLTIFFHHGFADGYHIGKFIDVINKNIAKIAEK